MPRTLTGIDHVPFPWQHSGLINGEQRSDRNCVRQHLESGSKECITSPKVYIPERVWSTTTGLSTISSTFLDAWILPSHDPLFQHMGHTDASIRPILCHDPSPSHVMILPHCMISHSQAMKLPIHSSPLPMLRSFLPML